MPEKGNGGRFSKKEDRQAEHIKDSEKKQGAFRPGCGAKRLRDGQ